MERAKNRKPRSDRKTLDETAKKLLTYYYANGSSMEELKLASGHSEKLIKRECGDELKKAKLQRNMQVANRIYEMALGKVAGVPFKTQATLCMFIAKTQLQWRETNNIEASVTHQFPTIKFVPASIKELNEIGVSINLMDAIFDQSEADNDEDDGTWKTNLQ